MNLSQKPLDRFRLRHDLVASAPYLNRLYNDLRRELSGVLSPVEVAHVDRMCELVAHDYERHGLIGKGYHCLEHSFELTVLMVKSWKNPRSGLPALSPSEMLEISVAGILHDYDPNSARGVPRVERTLYVLSTDAVLRDILDEMNLDIRRIMLLIERTDYPFTREMETQWLKRVGAYFADKEQRARFSDKAEKLALFDKGCAYFSLSPRQVQKRIEGLAVEMGLPRQKFILGTHDFLKKEKVAVLARWAPKPYWNRWKKVEKYFGNLWKNGAP